MSQMFLIPQKKYFWARSMSQIFLDPIKFFQPCFNMCQPTCRVKPPPAKHHFSGGPFLPDSADTTGDIKISNWHMTAAVGDANNFEFSDDLSCSKTLTLAMWSGLLCVPCPPRVSPHATFGLLLSNSASNTSISYCDSSNLCILNCNFTLQLTSVFPSTWTGNSITGDFSFVKYFWFRCKPYDWKDHVSGVMLILICALVSQRNGMCPVSCVCGQSRAVTPVSWEININKKR